MNRRDFIKNLGMGATSLLIPDISFSQSGLEEKISQLIITDIPKKQINHEFLDFINKYNIGGIFLWPNIFRTKDYAIKEIIKLKKQFKTPPFIATDFEGGKVNRLFKIQSFPSAKYLGKNYQLGNLTLEEINTYMSRKGEILNELGLNLNFDPVLDLSEKNSRCYNSNPNVVSELASSAINYQLKKGILTTAKHFPGIGQVEKDTHKYLPTLNKTREQLENYELIPFKFNLDVPLIMVGHIMVSSIDPINPSSLSYNIITKLLKQDLNYNGLIITDSLTMGAINIHYSKQKIFGLERIARRGIDAIKAGNDLLLNFNYKTIPFIIYSIKKAVINREISEQRIEESYEKIQKCKASIQFEL